MPVGFYGLPKMECMSVSCKVARQAPNNFTITPALVRYFKILIYFIYDHTIFGFHIFPVNLILLRTLSTYFKQNSKMCLIVFKLDKIT